LCGEHFKMQFRNITGTRHVCSVRFCLNCFVILKKLNTKINVLCELSAINIIHPKWIRVFFSDLNENFWSLNPLHWHGFMEQSQIPSHLIALQLWIMVSFDTRRENNNAGSKYDNGNSQLLARQVLKTRNAYVLKMASRHELWASLTSLNLEFNLELNKWTHVPFGLSAPDNFQFLRLSRIQIVAHGAAIIFMRKTKFLFLIFNPARLIFDHDYPAVSVGHFFHSDFVGVFVSWLFSNCPLHIIYFQSSVWISNLQFSVHVFVGAFLNCHFFGQHWCCLPIHRLLDLIEAECNCTDNWSTIWTIPLHQEATIHKTPWMEIVSVRAVGWGLHQTSITSSMI